MSCSQNCAGCAGCGKLGAYTDAPPLAFAGWRLRIGGNPPGGQYHGFLGAAPRRWMGSSPWDFFNPGHTAADGVYRSPGETPPSANPNRETNTIVVPHVRQKVGYAEVPGAFSGLGIISDPCAQVPSQFRAACDSSVGSSAVITAAPRLPIYPAPKPPITPIRVDGGFLAPKPVPPVLHPNYILTGATSVVPQAPPSETPAPAPTVPMNCPPAGTYRDAAGNLVCDWHNPYSLYLPEASQIQPAPIVAADTSLTPGAGQTPTSVPSGSVSGNAVNAAPSWFTDPNQELITGIPNWGLVAAAVGAFMLMRGRR